MRDCNDLVSEVPFLLEQALAFHQKRERLKPISWTPGKDRSVEEGNQSNIRRGWGEDMVSDTRSSHYQSVEFSWHGYL